eukprot:TRINITY_DN101973_c0_g1_i1.p1 TRINITY_DN101973_c0_g1~~TRINITY_DN101973_c0_g1_i1.p1  ORF type:complete len:413 (+),score=95.71 TRINITY_DN101973_c0_g1_i1:104-1342(+)
MLAAKLQCTAAEVQRKRRQHLHMQKDSDVRAWKLALGRVVSEAAKVAQAACVDAAARGAWTCSLDLRPLLAEVELASRFGACDEDEDGFATPIHDDAILRGYFFLCCKAGANVFEAPSRLHLTFAHLLRVAVPEVASSLRRQGVAVEIHERDVQLSDSESDGGLPRSAPCCLAMSWVPRRAEQRVRCKMGFLRSGSVSSGGGMQKTLRPRTLSSTAGVVEKSRSSLSMARLPLPLPDTSALPRGVECDRSYDERPCTKLAVPRLDLSLLAPQGSTPSSPEPEVEPRMLGSRRQTDMEDVREARVVPPTPPQSLRSHVQQHRGAKPCAEAASEDATKPALEDVKTLPADEEAATDEGKLGCALQLLTARTSYREEGLPKDTSLLAMYEGYFIGDCRDDLEDLYHADWCQPEEQ